MPSNTTKKLKKIVNAPHKAFGRARKKIEQWKPIGEYDNKWAKTGVGAAKFAGWNATAFGQLLSWILVRVPLDNAIIDFGEKTFSEMKVGKNKKTGKNKKLSGFAKRNPRIASYLIYYAIPLMLLGGVKMGRFVNKYIEDNKGKPDSAVVDEKSQNKSDKYVSADNKTEEEFIKEAMQAYAHELYVMLAEFETYYSVPKTNDGELRPTQGFGITYEYYEENGVLKRREISADDKRRRTKEELEYQAYCYMKKELFPLLYYAVKDKKNLDRKKVMALMLAGWQRPADMKHIAGALEKAETEQEIADAFLKMVEVEKVYNGGWLQGSLKRRWWGTMYALGYVTVQDLLDAGRDAFSNVEFSKLMPDYDFVITEYQKDEKGNVIKNKAGKKLVKSGYIKGHFKTDKETVKYARGKLATNDENKTVRHHFQDYNNGKVILEQYDTKTISFKDAIAQQEEDNDTAANEIIDLITKGDKAFGKKKYEKAIDFYTQALDKDSTDMEVYAALIKSYNALADSRWSNKKKITDYNNSIEKVKTATRIMNANKDDLLDYDIKSDLYFYAGQAREKLADIYKKQKDMDTAKENYGKASQNYDNAQWNCEHGSKNPERIEAATKAKEDTAKKRDGIKTEKVTAFNSGAKKVEQNAYMRGLAQYNRNKDNKNLG